MHWLEEQLASIHDLLERFEATRVQDANAALCSRGDEMVAVAAGAGATTRRAVEAIDSSSEKASLARKAFRDAIAQVADGIVARSGVTACVVAHEGLVVAQAGEFEGDAFAATTQLCSNDALTAAAKVALGTPRQMVIVGDQHKLALFFVGQMVVGILSPEGTSLSQTLSR